MFLSAGGPTTVFTNNGYDYKKTKIFNVRVNLRQSKLYVASVQTPVELLSNIDGNNAMFNFNTNTVNYLHKKRLTVSI